MSDHTPECVQMIIGYVTDPVPDYVTAIRAAKSLEELKRAISDYRLIAADALASAANLQESDWTEVQGFIKSGGRGKFASEAMLS